MTRNKRLRGYPDDLSEMSVEQLQRELCHWQTKATLLGHSQARQEAARMARKIAKMLDAKHEVEWNHVNSQADADALMELFGRFHDACVREAHLWTDHWVSTDLSMSCPGHLDNHIRFLVQRQFTNPAAIELLFEEVTRFNLAPTPDNYDTIILKATLLVRGDMVFWSTQPDWSPDSATRDESTWISAKRLAWREVDWLGEELHYGPH